MAHYWTFLSGAAELPQALACGAEKQSEIWALAQK